MLCNQVHVLVIKLIAEVANAVCSNATSGGLHPWTVSMVEWLAHCENQQPNQINATQQKIITNFLGQVGSELRGLARTAGYEEFQNRWFRYLLAQVFTWHLQFQGMSASLTNNIAKADPPLVEMVPYLAELTWPGLWEKSSKLKMSVMNQAADQSMDS